MNAFLFKVVSTSPVKVRVKILSNMDVHDSPYNGYSMNGSLSFTWQEWQAFARLHGWTGDITRCKMLVVGYRAVLGTGEPLA